jgi:hypothetical protein
MLLDERESSAVFAAFTEVSTQICAFAQIDDPLNIPGEWTRPRVFQRTWHASSFSKKRERFHI